MKLKYAFVVCLSFAAATLSAQSALPTPASSIGFDLGTDYKLATYTQSVEYL